MLHSAYIINIRTLFSTSQQGGSTSTPPPPPTISLYPWLAKDRHLAREEACYLEQQVHYRHALQLLPMMQSWKSQVNSHCSSSGSIRKPHHAVVFVKVTWSITMSMNHTLRCRPWQYFTTRAYAVSYLAAYGFQIGSWFFMIGGAALLDPRVGL